MQKAHSLTGQIISLEQSTETNTELLLSCKETGNSRRIPQIIPVQVTQAAVLLPAPLRAVRPGEGEQQRALGRHHRALQAVLGNSCSQPVPSHGVQLWWHPGWDTAGSQHRVCVHACVLPHRALQLTDNRKRSSGREMHKISAGPVSYLS